MFGAMEVGAVKKALEGWGLGMIDNAGYTGGC